MACFLGAGAAGSTGKDSKAFIRHTSAAARSAHLLLDLAWAEWEGENTMDADLRNLASLDPGRSLGHRVVTSSRDLPCSTERKIWAAWSRKAWLLP